jgi:hypothetical protein
MRLKYDKNKKKQSTVLYESGFFYKEDLPKLYIDYYPDWLSRRSLQIGGTSWRDKTRSKYGDELLIASFTHRDGLEIYNRSKKYKKLIEILENQYGPSRSFNSIDPPENPEKNNIKMSNKKTFPYTEKQVRDIANKIAKALTQVEGVKASPHDFDFGDGSGASFNMSLDGIKFDGGTYDVFSNGDIVNVAIGSQGVKAVYAKMGDSVAQIVRKIKKYDKMMDSSKSVVPPENPTQGDVFANISSNYSKMCRDNGMCSSLGR